MLKGRPLSRPLLLLLLLFLGGCAGLADNFQPPKVNLADIQVSEIRALEASFLVKMRILNPNDVPLEVHGLACDLELDGEQIATGLQGMTKTIPPYGTDLVEVNLYASMFDMVVSVLQLLQYNGQGPVPPKDTITYGLTGHLKVSTDTLNRTLPFESRGELDLSNMGRVSN